MFGQSEWKKQVLESIRQLELQVNDLKKSETELRAQNARLATMIKNLGRKMAMRMPISLESLEKGLGYDLIFADEVDTWKAATSHGVVLDIRAAHDHLKSAIPGAFNIPYDQLSMRLESLAKEQAILIVCENGIKSVSACELLNSKGYHYLYVLKGGMSLYRGQSAVQSDAPEARESDARAS